MLSASEHKSATTSLREALACILPSGSAETKDYKGLDGGAAASVKSDGAAKVMGMLEGGQTPPAPLQALSRAGSQDEDDLFNLGCNHSASEMWTSLSESREYQLHVPHDDPREQVVGLWCFVPDCVRDTTRLPCTMNVVIGASRPASHGLPLAQS